MQTSPETPPVIFPLPPYKRYRGRFKSRLTEDSPKAGDVPGARLGAVVPWVQGLRLLRPNLAAGTLGRVSINFRFPLPSFLGLAVRWECNFSF